MRPLSRTSLSLVLACSLLAGPTASAEPAASPPPPSAGPADQALERGVRLYNIRRYAEAIEEFRRGYELEPAPQLLFAMGQAYRLAGDCAAAVQSFRAYLRTGPLPHRAESATRLMKACEAELQKQAPPVTPTPPTVSPVTSVREPGPRPSLGRRYAATFSLLGLTGASLVAAATVQGLAGAEYDELRGSCAPMCSDDRVDALSRKLDASIGLWATTGALGLATIIALAIETKRPRR